MRTNNKEMADQLVITKPYIPLIFFAFFLLFPLASSAIKPEQPCKRFVLYYHDILFNGTDAANATSINVTAASPSVGQNFFMGMLVVFNDPMTKDNRLRSPPAATAQGFYFYDGKSSLAAWFGFTLVFNSAEHRGTLNIMGADLITEKTRDFSVVGGTGDFFMARGIVTVQTDTFPRRLLLPPQDGRQVV